MSPRKAADRTTAPGALKYYYWAVILSVWQSQKALPVAIVGAICCVGAVACSNETYQSGPSSAVWTEAEQEFVMKAREVDSDYYASDAVASRWIVAGIAACEALKDGVTPESSGEKVQKIVDMKEIGRASCRERVF